MAFNEMSQASKRLNEDGMHINYDNIVNLGFLFSLEMQGDQRMLDFCTRLGLIGDKYTCPKCKKNMKLIKNESSKDRFEWKCASEAEGNEHDVRRSVRRGSLFNQSRLDLGTILQIVYMWTWKLSSEFIMNEAKCASNTLVEWKGFCREVCLRVLVAESETVGGPGTTVDVNEIKFSKKRMFKGLQFQGEWVFGGMERRSGKCFFQVVGEKSVHSLAKVLKDFVLPGTVVVSDCWNFYHCLQFDSFQDLSDNHGLRFKDPDVKAHSHEDAWSSVVTDLNREKSKEDLDTYYAEYLWRRKNRGAKNRFMAFLDAIRKVCTPPCQDVKDAER